MKIPNSKNYASIPFEITPVDLALIFDELNIGIQKQNSIITSIWDNNKWILPKKYRYKKQRQKFIDDVLYQIDYLYNKIEIDGSLKSVIDNAQELGLNISSSNLSEDYTGVSRYFKQLWIQLKYLNSIGYARAKIRTILNRYGYKRRTDKFIEYFSECLYFYKIEATHHGKSIYNLSAEPIDSMITFHLCSKRKPKKKADIF